MVEAAVVTVVLLFSMLLFLSSNRPPGPVTALANLAVLLHFWGHGSLVEEHGVTPMTKLDNERRLTISTQ